MTTADYSLVIGFVVVPVFAVLVYLASRGSLRSKLLLLNFLFLFFFISVQTGAVWLGYFINYLDVVDFLSFGVQILILSIVLYCLHLLLQSVEITDLKQEFQRKPPLTQTALFYIFAAFMCPITVISMVLQNINFNNSTIKYDLPLIALNVLFLLPMYLSITILLFKKRPLGYALAPGFFLFPLIHVLFNIRATSRVLFYSGFRSGRIFLHIIFLMIFILGFALLILFLRSIKEKPVKEETVKNMY